jgi:hypothetical protein
MKQEMKTQEGWFYSVEMETKELWEVGAGDTFSILLVSKQPPPP